METKTIRFLPIEEMRVIKQVNIISESTNKNEYTVGYILYEREFSPNYKFKEVPKEERDFKYYLEYPRQDLYPSDYLDGLILQSIKNSFPKSKIRNRNLMCNVDKESTQLLQKRPVENSEITFTPDFSQIDISKLAGQSFEGLRKPIKIYHNNIIEDVKNLAFFGYYNIGDLHILDKIDNIKFI